MQGLEGSHCCTLSSYKVFNGLSTQAVNELSAWRIKDAIGHNQKLGFEPFAADYVWCQSRFAVKNLYANS